MSRGTKSFKTKSGQVLKVNRELLGSDVVVEKIFREAFVQPGCFMIAESNGYQAHLVLESHRNKSWTFPAFSLLTLNHNGLKCKEDFLAIEERTCLFFPANDVFQGFNFAISGRGQRWYRKDLLRTFIKLSGGVNAPMIHQSVDFLILARSNLSQDNAKIAFARRNKIEIISPREFMAIWFSEFRHKYREELKTFFPKEKLEKGPV